VLRLLGVLVLVVMAGTCGFVWIEGWSPWRAFYFTLITITTVGYGDDGLSPAGERFTVLVMISGIGLVTFSLGQLTPLLLDAERLRERLMYKQIMRLSDHYIICGLGRIGQAVCRRLALEDVEFVAIDADRESVQWAVGEGFLALQGDATEDEVLEEANIHNARAIICLTSSDADNIVITLSARGLCPNLFIISRAEQDDAIVKIQRAGASRVISPTRTGVTSITNAILNPHLSRFLEQTSETPDGIELAELVVDEQSAVEGSTVQEYGRAHPNIVFVAMKSSDSDACIRPEGGQRFHAGDVLIVAGDGPSIARLRSDVSAPRAAA